MAEILACSYPAVKDGKRDIYRHDFHQQDGRFPYLLEACPDKTQYRTPNGAPETAALGRLIDLELRDLETGEEYVALTPFFWICTTADAFDRRNGGPVLLGSRFKPLYAIEQRNGAARDRLVERHDVGEFLHHVGTSMPMSPSSN